MKTAFSVLTGVLAAYLVVYTVLVTPRRFMQCLDAPMTTYRRAPNEGLGAYVSAQVDGNTVGLLVNGDEILPAMLDLIDDAERNIRWHVMLFKPDEAGQQLAQALIHAAERGVDVQLAFDTNQSTNATFFSPYPPEVKARFNDAMPLMLANMRASGVTVLDSGTLAVESVAGMSSAARDHQTAIMRSTCVDRNHVDHRKVLIVDNEVAIVGGMNVGNEYLYLIPPDLSLNSAVEAETRQASDDPEAWEKWQDSAVLVSGPVIETLVADFNLRWELLSGTPLEPTPGPPSVQGPVPIRILRQHPGLSEISTGLVGLIDAAQNDIYLAYPFVSHPVLLNHLKAAGERGVRVVFVYPGDLNEVTVSRRMLRLFSGELLEAGIAVYEHNDRMLHTKIMVVDGRHVSIGSHNFNYRSVRLDQELNLFIEDEALAEEVVTRIFEPYMEQADLLESPYDLRWTPLDRLLLPFT